MCIPTSGWIIWIKGDLDILDNLYILDGDPTGQKLHDHTLPYFRTLLWCEGPGFDGWTDPQPNDQLLWYFDPDRDIPRNTSVSAGQETSTVESGSLVATGAFGGSRWEVHRCRPYVPPSKRYPQSQFNHRAESDQAWQIITPVGPGRKGCQISPGIRGQRRWDDVKWTWTSIININWPGSSTSSYSLQGPWLPLGPGLASTIRRAMWSLRPGVGITGGRVGAYLTPTTPAPPRKRRIRRKLG